MTWKLFFVVIERVIAQQSLTVKGRMLHSCRAWEY